MTDLRRRRRESSEAMKELLSGRNFSVKEVLYKVKGIRRRYRIITKSDTVLIIPILGDGRIMLERQWRYPVKGYIYELPAGTVEKREPPVKTAARELEEETGYKAKRMRFLFKGYPAPGLMDEMMHFYIAEGLYKGKIALDKDEIISTKTVSLAKAISMVKKGDIVDTKTIAALLYYSAFRKSLRL